MNHWKKALSALTASLILLSAAGCSSNSNTSGSTSGSDASQNSSSGSSSAQVHKLTILAPKPSDPNVLWDEREEYPVYQELEKMLEENGLEFEAEVVPAEQYSVVIQTRMSASNLPDIVNLSTVDNTTALAYGKQGVIQELTPLIEQYSNGNIDHMFGEVYPGYPLVKTADDKMYWFSNLHIMTYQDEPCPSGLTILVRQDWLDKLNIPTPTTAEEFTEMMREFRNQDVNESGAADEIFDLPVSTFANGVAQWFGLGCYTVSADPANRQIVSPWYQDGIQDYFRYVQSLVQEGIVDASLIGSNDLSVQRKAENKTAAQFNYATAGWLDAEVQNVEGVDYEPLMPLQAVDGIVPAMVTEPAELVWEKFAITRNCTDVEGAIKLFDMVYTEDYATLISWGVEGQGYEYQDGVKVNLPLGTTEEQAAAKNTTGSTLWGTVLPRVQMRTWDSELITGNFSDTKKEFSLEAITYEPYVTLYTDNYLAMPTDEETETINQLTTALETYSTELCTKLCLGQASLDDWDTYMAEFEELGLQQLIDIQQARMDRFFEMQES